MAFNDRRIGTYKTALLVAALLAAAACGSDDATNAAKSSAPVTTPSAPATSSEVASSPAIAASASSAAAASTSAPASSSVPASSSAPAAAPSAASSAAVSAQEPIAVCIGADQQAEQGVTIKRADGGDVEALVTGTGKRGIVFANSAEGDLCEWLVYADGITAKDYTAVVFNYSGGSGDDDVLAAASLLRERGATSIILVGADKGGTFALSAAAKLKPAPDAVVSLSGLETFEGVDALAAAKTLTVPVFFGVGEFDGDSAPAAATTMHKALKSKEKVLKVVGTGYHGSYLLGDTSLSEELDAFLAMHSK